MKLYFFLISWGLCLWGCMPEAQKDAARALPTPISSIEIPSLTLDKAAVQYDRQISSWLFEGQCYSGYVESFYDDGSLKQRFGVFDGRKQNKDLVWYPDGHLKFESNYHLGKLHGEKKMWSSSPDHVLLSHLNYQAGKVHGQQKKWYPTGEIFKVLNLNMGREEGQQRAYRKNGAIFANYEARNGRIFGMKKATLCFGLEDEEVKTKEN